MTDTPTRRGFLKLGAVGIASTTTAGLAGCSAITGGDDGGSSPLSVVPEGVTSVAYADLQGMLEDEALTELLNELLELASEEFAYTGPTTKEGLLEDIRAESDLDPAGLDEAIIYASAPDASGTPTPDPTNQYAATWFTAEWEESELIGEMEGPGSDLESSEYEGHTIYESTAEYDETAVAILAEGEFVIGTGQAARDAVDVTEGNMESVGSALTEPYSSVRSGLFKAATIVPDERLPDEPVDEGGVSVDPEQLADVDSSVIVGYHEGETLGTKATIQATDTDAAEDLAAIIDGAIATGENTVESEELAGALDAVSVEQSESTITLQYESDVETISALMAALVAEYKRLTGIGIETSEEDTRTTRTYPIPLAP